MTGERLCFTFLKPELKSRMLPGHSGPVANVFQAARGMSEKMTQTSVVKSVSNDSRSPRLSAVQEFMKRLYQSPGLGDDGSGFDVLCILQKLCEMVPWMFKDFL
jgi:hypothetical protein